MNAFAFRYEWLPSCFLIFLTLLSFPKVLALRRGGATSGYWLPGWDPLWLQRYRWAWRDLNLVLALPTRLLSLVLRSIPVGILGCDQGKQYNHRRHRGTGGGTLSTRSKDSWRRKGYISPSDATKSDATKSFRALVVYNYYGNYSGRTAVSEFTPLNKTNLYVWIIIECCTSVPWSVPRCLSIITEAQRRNE